MKGKIKINVLAAVVAMAMTLQLIPSVFIHTFAEVSTDSVKILVQDEDGNAIKDAEVTYTITAATSGSSPIEGTKSTDENGYVDILPEADYQPNEFKVSAEISKDSYVADTTTIHENDIDAKDKVFKVELKKVISFPKDKTGKKDIDYVIGENEEGIVSEKTAVLGDVNDTQGIAYEIDHKDVGILCDENTGVIRIDDYTKLQEALNNSDTVSVQVTATTINTNDTDTYQINISYLTIENADDIYEINAAAGTENWYRAKDNESEVTVKIKDAFVNQYAVSKGNSLTDTFNDSVSLAESGEDQIIYLRDKASKGISKAIVVKDEKGHPIKVDTTAPDISTAEIVFNNTNNTTWKVLENLTLAIFDKALNQSIIFTTAQDNGSEIAKIEWSYRKETNASNKNEESLSGVIERDQLTINEADKKVTAVVDVPFNKEDKQYRGYISFAVIDKAGNKSAYKGSDENGEGFIVDTLSPTKEVRILSDHPGTPQGNITYYKNNVTFEFIVNEANFDKEDIEITLTDLATNTDQKLLSSQIEWKDDGDLHTGTYQIAKDGYYQMHMTYTDKSGNDMEEYISDEFVIDTVKPILNIVQNKESNDPSATLFQINEHNFDSKDIEIKVSGKDLIGNSLSEAYLTDLNKRLNEAVKNEEWQITDDMHQFIYQDYLNGQYDFEFTYKDLAGNEAVTVQKDIVIQRKLPKVNKVEPEDALNKITKDKQTTRFYQSAVDFKLYVAKGDIPLEKVEWMYVKNETAAAINEASDKNWRAVPELDADADYYIVTLPSTHQYDGYLKVRATDEYGNISEIYYDRNNLFVIDTVSPELKVEYTQANRDYNHTSYYNKDVTVTFAMKEASFYQKQFDLTVIKDNKPTHETVKWKQLDAENWLGTYTLKEEGNYTLEASYTDYSNNSMKKFQSKRIEIDKTKPLIEVSYSNTNVIRTMKDQNKKDRKYFDADQSATITIKEHNFKADEVNFYINAKDVSGKTINKKDLYTKSKWKHEGDIHTITLTYSGEANYDFDIEYTDLAANKAADYQKDYFTVDKTAPKNLRATYDDSVFTTTVGDTSFGYYNAKTRVTITAEDEISGVHDFVYSYTNAKDVSSLNAQLINQAISESKITYSKDGKTATMFFDIPKSVLDRAHQFNGTIQFTASDRADNHSTREEKKRIVVDNITPAVQVGYNNPVNEDHNISYYDGAINATIMVNEANFYSQDVVVSVSKDHAAAQQTQVNWTKVGNDEYEGKFSLFGDGDYIVSINYSDRSGNTIVPYTSRQLTIDTNISEPIITINGNEADQQAFKDEVSPSVQFEDKNFDDYELKMTQTHYQNQNMDVTDKMGANQVSVNETGGNGTFNGFKKERDIDGIYTIDVKINDKAGHSSEATKTFTVNRFGSIYEYNNYLASLIKDGGAYVNAIDQNLVITEYNADRLLADSVDIEITKDGLPLNDVDYTSSAVSDQVTVGNSGWYQYQYTINKNNFQTDGVYKISVSSKDATGNAPENDNYKDKSILFRVDSTAPEITGVTGLENAIINAQEVAVNYHVFDTIGLKKIQVLIDGEIKDTVDTFDDSNNYNGTFALSESDSAQNVQFIVEDLAGNITDTNSEDFSCAYDFHSTVTVSTNALIRFYANKPLFYGVIVSIIAIVSGVGYYIVLKRKKTEETSEA